MSRRDVAAIALCAQSLAFPGWGMFTICMRWRAGLWAWLAVAAWCVSPWCGLVVHLGSALATVAAWAHWHDRNGWYFDAMRPADG